MKSVSFLIVPILLACFTFGRKTISHEFVEEETEFVIKQSVKESGKAFTKVGLEFKAKSIAKENIHNALEVPLKAAVRISLAEENQFISSVIWKNSKVIEKTGLPKSGTILLENMLKYGADINRYIKMGGHQAHHIVGAGPGTEPSRMVLKKFNIDINSAVNGVLLPSDKKSLYRGTIHNTSHSKDYIEGVNKRLVNLKTKEDVLKELDNIRRELVKGKIILRTIENHEVHNIAI